MAARGNQRSGRNSLASTSIPQKRRTRGSSAPSYVETDDSGLEENGISNGHTNKKVKTEEPETQENDFESEIVNVITDFNLCVNELFQLKEYGSLVEWNPQDFSRAINPLLPEIYEYFINKNNYHLIWDEALLENMDAIPLRLQKKKILEREAMLKEKYPFKDSVIERSINKEASLLQNRVKEEPELPPPTKSIKKEPKSRSKAQRPKVEEILSPELEPELDSDLFDFDFNEEDLNTNYKVKKISFSIPPQKVTHPSHIPTWRPAAVKDSDIVGGQEEYSIPEFDPQPLQVIADKNDQFHVPTVEEKLHDFLTNKFKAPIVDDSNNDFNNTPEEFNHVLEQQRHLLQRLYSKIVLEERFEVNADKIERRKVIAPSLSNQKITSDPFRDNGAIAPKIQGAANDSTYQDYVLAQGMAFSKIHQLMRRQHQARTRRIAQMVDQHFRKKRGEKERLQREQEQNLRRISRMAIQAVKKRWSQAHRVYRQIQHEKEEQIKQIEGREHLSKMLEHSTQLLEQQLQSEGKSGDDLEDSNDSDSNDEHDSDSFSSSNSESEEEPETDVTEKPDSECTVEELRKKYANLEDSVEPSLQAESQANSDIEDAEDSDDDDDEPAGLAALYGGKDVKPQADLVPSEEYTEEQKKLIESYENTPDVEMLESSDQSSDLMTEESSSELESDEEVNDDENVEEVETGEGKKSALASLYDEQNDERRDSAESSGSTVDEEEPKTPSNYNEEKDEKSEEVNGLRVKDVPLPPLLKGELRPYQKQGLNWLASLYNNNTNGILADEMGLGKTIQTIALLSYLACEHHIWGPHLIVVPTSVMLNWEMEFKKFAPGFKVLTYYGSPQERARKRKGWNKIDAFHICITSYQLVVHDHSSFKRRKWRYMILDEAHNIKNFRSTRWKALLNFNTENRLLLTGTPLQNNLMELWSLLYFLMPSSKVDQMMPEGFANFEDFQQWFGKPVDKILEKTSTGELIDENVTNRLDEETKNTVSRLHQVLRPYLLRRLKKDVEQQMPGKYEHIVYCRLSKRQRYLYDDFMSRAKTKETLASGNFLSIINCLMQLRKVCNHPDLFEVRPIVTSYAVPKTVSSNFNTYKDNVQKLIKNHKEENVSLPVLNLDLTNADDMNYFAAQARQKLRSTDLIRKDVEVLNGVIAKGKDAENPSHADVLNFNRHLKLEEQIEHRDRLQHMIYLNELRCLRAPLYGVSTLDFLKNASKKFKTETLQNMELDIPLRAKAMHDTLEKFAVITPKVVGLDMKDQLIPLSTQYRVREDVQLDKLTNPFHQSQVKLSIAFPDKQLLQYDCGKLQKLASLLQDLVPKGHRALIFTQMTKVLDILEQFLNIHGYRYMRLDGATKIEDRQLLTEKFNRDPRIPVFILSTRSGGLGINLTGADTVVFYDSDWNPAMDKQCQDRCHRIGQLRDVHIYRFVSEYTIESNILKKANQKRQLDNVVIQEGEFTTDYLGKFSVRDLVNDANIITELPDKPIGENTNVDMLAQAEDEADRNAAKEALKEVAVDDEDFNEEKKSDDPKKPSAGQGENLDDADYDEGVGHIDEYMLRYIAEGHYAE